MFFFSGQKVWNFKLWVEPNSIQWKIVQVKIKEKEEEEEEPAKKVRLRVYNLCIIFSYKKNRDIFISLCGQESSIIEQCLATKRKVHRNPLVFS